MTHTTLVHSWFDGLWNNGDESTIDRLLAPDCIAHGLGDGGLVGTDAFHTFYRTFRAAFPSIRVNVERVLECDDFATTLASLELVPASGGGPYRIVGSATVRIRDSQIVEAWNYFDFLSLLTQMGAVRTDVMEKALAPQLEP